MESFINPKEDDGEQHLVIKLKILGTGLFKCNSLQRQFKDKMGNKYNGSSVVVVNYNVNNKKNQNIGTQKIVRLVS